MTPTQPIAYGQKIRYQWKQLPGTENMSLKNSHYFGNGFMSATDMLRGGTIILRYDSESAKWVEHQRCFPGWRMMWAPSAVQIDGRWYLYCCDTAGGDTASWWLHMRIYRHWIDLVSKKSGPLEKITVSEAEAGMIDPFLIRIGAFWYLFVAELLDPDGHYWDPQVFCSKSPAGPFTNGQHLGNINRGIDEAPKVALVNNEMMFTYSSGDSGLTGDARIGKLVVVGQHADGYLLFKINAQMESTILMSDDSDLCTALDITRWPSVYATLRKRDAGRYLSDMVSGFYLAELG